MSTNVKDAIIGFWLDGCLENPEAAFARRDWWYKGGAAVDDEIQARFGALVEQACHHELSDWQSTSNGAFALVLLLDQFTRNIYRNTPDAYAGDPIAFDIVQHAIDQNLDRELHPVSRIWLYHPFHHSEQIEQQDRGLQLLNDLIAAAPSAWHPYINRSITGWTRHRNIVARFGRFPHRNVVLDRVTTDAEKTFLESEGEAFGQGPATAGNR